MIVYVASYATGLGNIPRQQGELFSLEVRGIGSSLCTTTNWAANLLIGATYLSLMDRITRGFRVLCWAVPPGVDFLFVLFPGDGGFDARGGAVSV